MNDAFSWLELLKTFIAILIGAAGSGIPLWYKLRALNQKLQEGGIRLKGQEAKMDRKDEEAREELDQQKKINAEAEWKRIIEFRDLELARLRDRDDQQERQLLELWNKHIECQRNESAQAERIKAQDQRITAYETRLQVMEKQLAELLNAVITKGKG